MTAMHHRSLTLLLLLGLAAPSAAQRAFVDWTAPPGGDGLSWETAFSTLQPALAAAVAGDEIWVAAGIYQGGFVIPDGVVLRGGFKTGDERASQARPTARASSSVIGRSAGKSPPTGAGAADPFGVGVVAGAARAGSADETKQQSTTHGRGRSTRKCITWSVLPYVFSLLVSRSSSPSSTARGTLRHGLVRAGGRH